MAHHKSAKKRIRSNATKRLQNSSYMSGVRRAIRVFRASVESGLPKDEVQSLLVRAQKLVDKATIKGLLHRNTASRNVSRMSHLFTKFESGTLEAAKVASHSASKKKSKVSKKSK